MSSTSPGAIAGPEGKPVVRLRSPADVCEAVPYLVGFEPVQSLVVVSLRGPRRRAGLTARVDLPDPGDARALAELLVEHLERDGASSAIVVAYTDQAGPAPERAHGADVAAQAVLEACRVRGIEVAEALRVSDGRWTSYTCAEGCCPRSGTPVRDRLTTPSVFSAAMVAEGRHVLADRRVLEKSIAPVRGLLATAMRSRLAEEIERFLAAVRGDEPSAYGDETVRLVHTWAGRVARGDALTVDAAARMIAGLLDREVRDRCMGGGMSSLVGAGDAALDADALGLWCELARRALLPRTAAPVATLLAACAYLDHGNGALANVALERALADQPSYVMAHHLRAMLDGGIAPSTVRRLVTHSEAEPGNVEAS